MAHFRLRRLVAVTFLSFPPSSLFSLRRFGHGSKLTHPFNKTTRSNNSRPYNQGTFGCNSVCPLVPVAYRKNLKFLVPIASSATGGVPFSTCSSHSSFASVPALIASCSVADFAALTVLYKAASYFDGLIKPEILQLPHPSLHDAAKFSLWAIYSFWAGLVGTGLWIIAHECGHQAFSESKFLNNIVGWVLHSGWIQTAAACLHARVDQHGLDWAFHIIRGASPMQNITPQPVT